MSCSKFKKWTLIALIGITYGVIINIINTFCLVNNMLEMNEEIMMLKQALAEQEEEKQVYMNMLDTCDCR